jgi:hypothetical protein
VALEYDVGGSLASIYINGALHGQTGISGFVQTARSNGYIGTYQGTSSATYVFNGIIANMQVYNTSLDVNQIQTLYQEGIGGAPVSPQNIVGWWPLNGDTKDYSGNNNNGVPTAVTYTAQYGK